MMIEIEIIKMFWINTQQVLLDTNVLILYLACAACADSNIRGVPRLAPYIGREKEAFSILYEMIQRYDHIVVNNSIMTEVSNVFYKIDKKTSKIINNYIADSLVNSDHILVENHSSMDDIIKDKSFHYLRYTDSSILNLHDGRIGVITMDGNLYYELLKRKIPTLNFTHQLPGFTR